MSKSGTVFNNKNQIKSIYLDYLESVYPKLDSASGSPNHGERITTADYTRSVEELAEPFSEAVRAFYAV